MDEQERYRIWILGAMMYEVDVEILNVGGEMIPLIDFLLLLSPIVFVGPKLVQLSCPLGGEAIFSSGTSTMSCVGTLVSLILR